jgi:Xaa-Pro dipeptidase
MTSPLTIDYRARIAGLSTLPGVDAVALVPGSNLRYFTGLPLMLQKRPVIALITRDGLAMILPSLEHPTLRKRPDLADARLFLWSDTDGYESAFADAIESLNLTGGTLGVDGLTMRVTEWLTFQSLDPTMRVRPVERELIAIRARKTPDEIALMRRACEIAEAALETVVTALRPGITERQIAALLDRTMLDSGADDLAFEAHVQIGENADNPHGNSGDRRLQVGDGVLIDFGCKVHGYPSDITRTFVYGAPTEQFRAMYAAVLAANAAGRAAAGPGVRMGDVDKAARQAIEAAGFGDYFTHRTGHGLGLDIHEAIPQIAANVDDLLQPGMTFTIEPGVYLPGVGGVRIEDNVVVTMDGIDVLTQFPRELRDLSG